MEIPQEDAVQKARRKRARSLRIRYEGTGQAAATLLQQLNQGETELVATNLEFPYDNVREFPTNHLRNLAWVGPAEIRVSGSPSRLRRVVQSNLQRFPEDLYVTFLD